MICVIAKNKNMLRKFQPVVYVGNSGQTDDLCSTNGSDKHNRICGVEAKASVSLLELR